VPPAPIASLTWTAVAARRMNRHALTEASAQLDPAGIAAVLCGVHAQVLAAAELSLGRRIAGATRSDVRHALWQDRTLVKTFGPRGTVHLLPAADLPMWTGALSALSLPPTHPDGVRFTPDQADEVIGAIGDALADTELTVDELTEAIARRTGPWAVEQTMEAFGGKWPRWRQLTGAAAHRGVLCFGQDRARNATYTNPARWLPGFRPASADAALRTLLTRYLYAYGPATPQHFARWLAISPSRAASLFVALSADLERVDLDGTPAWTLAGDTQVPAEPPRGIRLLPGRHMRNSGTSRPGGSWPYGYVSNDPPLGGART
jgi:Winged helix DNA-binding domain